MLFFPEEEPSFSVNELIETLTIPKIDVHKFKGKHGFSDSYSPNYNVESSKLTFDMTISFFNKILKE